MGGRVHVIDTRELWDKLQRSAKSDSRAIIVDFTATWCGPCRMISPIFEQLSEHYEDVLFLQVDVDQMEEIAAECGVSAMPTFQVWQDGSKVEELVGASKDRLENLVQKYSKK